MPSASPRRHTRDTQRPKRHRNYRAMSSARIPAHIRGLLRSAGVSLLVTLATLAAIELVLRTADVRPLRQDASERSLTYGYDAELGWAPIPYSMSTVTNARTIHARHNS